MKCSALYEVDDNTIGSIPCDNEAVWLCCTPVSNIPVCAEHKCRCNKRIPEPDKQLVLPVIAQISGNATRVK